MTSEKMERISLLLLLLLGGIIICTLLKIIKGTNIGDDTPGLPYKLHFVHSMCD